MACTERLSRPFLDAPERHGTHLRVGAVVEGEVGHRERHTALGAYRRAKHVEDPHQDLAVFVDVGQLGEVDLPQRFFVWTLVASEVASAGRGGGAAGGTDALGRRGDAFGRSEGRRSARGAAA